MEKGIIILTTIKACLLFARHRKAKQKWWVTNGDDRGLKLSDLSREPYRQSGIELDDGRKMYHNGLYYYIV